MHKSQQTSAFCRLGQRMTKSVRELQAFQMLLPFGYPAIARIHLSRSQMLFAFWYLVLLLMCSLLHPLWILCFLTLRCALAPISHWSGSVPLPVNREAHWWASWCFCGYMLSLVSSENEIWDLLHYSVVSCFINLKNVWVEHTNQNFMNWFFIVS